MKKTVKVVSDKQSSSESVEFVELDVLDPKSDPAEVQPGVHSDPTEDSPGDSALLEQEELYEGIESDRMPSEKREDSDTD